MSQQNDCCMVLSTTNNEKNRDEIIKGLLEAQLAACIQTMPIESHYVWKGEVCTDHEWLLIIKTRRELYELVEEKLKTCTNTRLLKSYRFLSWMVLIRI